MRAEMHMDAHTNVRAGMRTSMRLSPPASILTQSEEELLRKINELRLAMNEVRLENEHMHARTHACVCVNECTSRLRV